MWGRQEGWGVGRGQCGTGPKVGQTRAMQWRRGLRACQGVASRLASRLAEREGKEGQRLWSTRALLPSAPSAARPGGEPVLESQVTSHTSRATSHTPQATGQTPPVTGHSSQVAAPRAGPRGRGSGQHPHEGVSQGIIQWGTQSLISKSLSSSVALAAATPLSIAFSHHLSTGASNGSRPTVTPGPDTVTPGAATVTPGPDTVTAGTDIVTPGAATVTPDSQAQDAQGAGGAQGPEGAQGSHPGEARVGEEVVPVGQGKGLFRRAVRLQEVVIVGAARTAVGSFQGGLASFRAPELGGSAIAGRTQGEDTRAGHKGRTQGLDTISQRVFQGLPTLSQNLTTLLQDLPTFLQDLVATFPPPPCPICCAPGALARAGVAPSAAQEVIMGQVLNAGLG